MTETTTMTEEAMSPADIINTIGASEIAEKLSVSPQAVRSWRNRLPSGRVGQLMELASDRGLTMTATERSTTVSVGARHDSLREPVPDADPALASAEPVAVAIAKRDVVFARAHASHTGGMAGGLPPQNPMPFYGLRLASLALLDLPVLATAFVAVAQASLLVAVFSALGLAVFLILGAHALGRPLRQLASVMPGWVPGMIGILVLTAFLAAAAWTILDLRAKGLDADQPRFGG